MGKICVSVFGETLEELSANADSATEIGVIELRIDSLATRDSNQINHFLVEFAANYGGCLLVTFRPLNEGGFREITREERVSFWRSLLAIPSIIVDIEPDIIDEIDANRFASVISSFHDFSRIPKSLETTFSELRRKGDIAKIAFSGDEPSDGIDAWQVLCANKGKLIPIEMGEAGAWTRILGLAYGAPITYSSLGRGEETAPGQISYEKLRDLYRAEALNTETEVYGLIGDPVSHSVSPEIHNSVFIKNNENKVYISFKCSDLERFFSEMLRHDSRKIELNFRGFSVTIPHKCAIIEKLDFIDETSQKIGAVNTITEIDGKWCGFNTDAEGFIAPLLARIEQLSGRSIAILGAGGAARACAFSLQNRGAKIVVYARNIEQARSLANEFGCDYANIANFSAREANSEIIVNATPFGMKGKYFGESPVSDAQLGGAKLVYDLVFNPMETALIAQARRNKIETIGGVEMLAAQASLQQKIWTGEQPRVEQLIEIATDALSSSA